MTLVLHLWLAALCVTIIGWGTGHLTRAAVDAHRRGVARVHAGQSWQCRCLDCRDGRQCSR